MPIPTIRGRLQFPVAWGLEDSPLQRMKRIKRGSTDDGSIRSWIQATINKERNRGSGAGLYREDAVGMISREQLLNGAFSNRLLCSRLGSRDED